VRVCVRACVSQCGMKETQLLIVKIQVFNKLYFYTTYETQHIISSAGQQTLTGKIPLVSVEKIYSGAETRSFMGEYQ